MCLRLLVACGLQQIWTLQRTKLYILIKPMGRVHRKMLDGRQIVATSSLSSVKPELRKQILGFFIKTPICTCTVEHRLHPPD